jgi:murein DD-endopeptidase MepM/ murein hydrolase activator NlpD
VPSNQRFPHARRRWRPRVRYVLIGAAASLTVLVVLPAAAPRGSVLDLHGQGAAPDAIAQGPTAGPSTPTPATPKPATPGPAKPSPAAHASSAAASPAPTASLSLPIGTTSGTVAMAPRVLPSRFAAEVARKKAPALDQLTGYRWPVARVRLTLPFGPTVWGSRIVDGARFHDGIDLATFCGDRVVAAHDGRVLAAGRRFDTMIGWVGDLGPYLRRLDRNHLWSTLPIMVVTDDGNGYRSMYAHFGRIVVKPGDRVKAGQLLGYEGATGRASGCHVHYGLFSPWESATFAIKPDVAKRMKLPKTEIARVDPLLVLPPKRGVNAPKVPKASPSSSPGPSQSPSAAQTPWGPGQPLRR